MTAITKETRIQNLSTLLEVATLYQQQNRALISSKGSKWVKQKAEAAIGSLEEIIERIRKDMEPENVDAYCVIPPDLKGVPIGESQDPDVIEKKMQLNRYWSEISRQIQPAFTQIDIVRLAPENNIIHDITWLRDGVVGDYIEFALGTKKVTAFAQYLPACIAEVKINLIPFYKSLPGYEGKVNVINDAIEHSTKNNFISSNILLITVAESIVRDLCRHVYRHQNPDATPEEIQRHYQQYTSLQRLILEGGWKDDYPIRINVATVDYFDVYEPTINRHRERVNAHRKAYRELTDMLYYQEKVLRESNGEITEEQRLTMMKQVENMEKISRVWIGPDDVNVFINLSTMLNFLARKYKDDRNMLIHGDFAKLNQQWMNYMNFAALTEVTEVYQKYLLIYPHPDSADRTV